MAVNLVGPDGKEYTLPDDARLQEAIAAGYRPLGEEGRTFGESLTGLGTDLREGVVTAAEGVLRGGTAGLSDPLLKAAGYTGATPEAEAFNLGEMNRRKEEMPIVAGASELTGIIASPLSKISAGVAGGLGATTAVGRIGTGIVGGAVEGGLFGAGNAISEATLGNSDLTAEKLIAGAGLGMALGGVGGGFGHALDEGIKLAGPMVSKGLLGLSPRLKEFADQRWLKAAGGIQGDIKKIPEGERLAVADVLRRASNKIGGIDDELVGAELEASAGRALKAAGLDDLALLLKPGIDREAAIEALESGFRGANAKKLAVLDAAESAGAGMNLDVLAKRLDDFEGGLSPIKLEAVSGDLAAARRALRKYGWVPPEAPPRAGTVALPRAGETLVGDLDAFGKPLVSARRTIVGDVDEFGKPIAGAQTGALTMAAPKSKQGAFRALDEFRQDMQGKAKWESDQWGADLKRQLAGIVRDEVDSQLAPQVGQKLAKDFLDAKAALGAMAEAEKALRKKSATAADAIQAAASRAPAAERDVEAFVAANRAAGLLKGGRDRELNRFISPSDYGVGIAGALLAGGPGAALAGVPAAIAHKLVREHGAGAVAKLADAISRNPSLKLAAVSFAQKVPSVSTHFGEYGPPLALAIGQSPAVGLAHHIINAEANPDYAEKAAAAGFLSETPEEVGHVASKTAGLLGIAAALKGTDDAIDAGIRKVFRGRGEASTPNVTGSQDFGTRRMRRSEGGHERRMNEVAELAANPEALLERVTKNLGATGDAAPGVAAAATAVAHRAVTYLASQIQKPPKAGPLAREWKFNDTELFIFSKKLEAVEEPLSVLEYAAAGTLTKDQVEAVKVVYPTVYAQMRDKALEAMVSVPGKNVPYKARLAIHLLTGVDPDGSVKSTATNQQAMMTEAGRPSEQMARGSGKSDMTLAKDMATPGQRREMEGEDA